MSVHNFFKTFMKTGTAASNQKAQFKAQDTAERRAIVEDMRKAALAEDTAAMRELALQLKEQDLNIKQQLADAKVRDAEDKLSNRDMSELRLVQRQLFELGQPIADPTLRKVAVEYGYDPDKPVQYGYTVNPEGTMYYSRGRWTPITPAAGEIQYRPDGTPYFLEKPMRDMGSGNVSDTSGGVGGKPTVEGRIPKPSEMKPIGTYGDTEQYLKDTSGEIGTPVKPSKTTSAKPSLQYGRPYKSGSEYSIYSLDEPLYKPVNEKGVPIKGSWVPTTDTATTYNPRTGTTVSSSTKWVFKPASTGKGKTQFQVEEKQRKSSVYGRTNKEKAEVARQFQQAINFVSGLPTGSQLNIDNVPAEYKQFFAPLVSGSNKVILVKDAVKRKLSLAIKDYYYPMNTGRTKRAATTAPKPGGDFKVDTN